MADEVVAGQFFVAGGTLPPEADSYVERAADFALFSALKLGKFCYVLNSRQMGKSSLCVRTMKRLKAEGTRTAFVDLTRIGGRNVTPEQWYTGIAVEIGRSLNLRAEFLDYWTENAHLSPVQRLFGSLEEVALERLREPITIFFDEIDATRSLPFSVDEFFAAIRECYNRRVQEQEYKRITFCLLGVAVPSDLINSPTSTPFNIGERIYLRDFTLDETMALAKGIAREGAEKLVERAYHWTNGHPFLTQSLCQAIASDERICNRQDVDALVRRELFDPAARETNINLADVANRALHAGDLEVAPDKFRADLLSAYESAWKGKPLADDESNRVAALLKLSGLMRSEGNRLYVRNRIYERVFDKAWIRENMPGQELRRQRRAFRLGVLRAAGMALVVVVSVIYLAVRNAQLAQAAGELAANERKARQESDKLRAQAERFSYQAYAVTLANADEAFNKREYGKALELLWDLEQQPQRGWELSLLANRFHRIGRFFPAHSVRVSAVTFLPNGIFVTVGDRGSIALWDPASGRLIRRISLYRVHARAQAGLDARAARDASLCAPGADSRHLALGFMSGKVAWFDFARGRVAWAKEGDFESLGVVLVDPSGKQLFASSNRPDGKAILYSAEDGRVLKRFSLGHAIIQAAAWSPDRKLLAVSTMEPAMLQVLRTSDWTQIWSSMGGFVSDPDGVKVKEDFYCLQLSRDGKRIFAGAHSGRIYAFDANSGARQLIAQTSQFWPGAIYLLPGEAGWVTTTRDDAVRFWGPDFKGSPAVRQVRQTIWTAALSPDGTLFATGGDSGVHLWAVPKPGRDVDVPARLVSDVTFGAFGKKTPATAITSLHVSPDGALIAALLEKVPEPNLTSVMVLNASDGSIRWSKTTGPIFINTLARDGKGAVLSSDGKLLAYSDDVGTHTLVCRMVDGSMVARLPSSSGLAFSLDGSRFAAGAKVGTDDSTAKYFLDIYDTATWRKIGSREIGRRPFRGADFSPDGKQIALAMAANAVYLLNASTQGPITKLAGYNNELICVRFSSDGRTLYTCGFDQTLRIWDLATGKEPNVIALPPSLGANVSIDFLAGESRAAIGSMNGFCIVDPKNRRVLLTVPFGTRIAGTTENSFLTTTSCKIYRFDAPSVPPPEEGGGP